MRSQLVRFIISGGIILIENTVQMSLFYDDQLSVGNSWTVYMSFAPMLSNALFCKWCATVPAAVYGIFKYHASKNMYYWLTFALSVFLCIGVQLMMLA